MLHPFIKVCQEKKVAFMADGEIMVQLTEIKKL